MKILPKIETPSFEDFEKAIEFHGGSDRVYTDEERNAICATARKLMMARKTIH